MTSFTIFMAFCLFFYTIYNHLISFFQYKGGKTRMYNNYYFKPSKYCHFFHNQYIYFFFFLNCNRKKKRRQLRPRPTDGKLPENKTDLLRFSFKSSRWADGSDSAWRGASGSGFNRVELVQPNQSRVGRRAELDSGRGGWGGGGNLAGRVKTVKAGMAARYSGLRSSA